MRPLSVDKEVQEFVLTAPLRFRDSFRNVLDVGSCAYHHHSCFEIVLHTDCSGSTSLETGQRLLFQASSVVINPPYIKHDQRTQKAGTDSCILVETTCSVPEPLNQIIYIPNVQAPWIFSDINLLTNIRRSPTILSARALHYRAASLFLQLLQHADTSPDASSLSPTTALALEADRLLRTEYASLHSVREIAHRLAVSADHLRHSYRRHFGVGMKQRLLQLRIERGSALLMTTSLPIKAIATACGFADDRSFALAFKAAMACTASEYRQKCRQTESSATRTPPVSADG